MEKISKKDVPLSQAHPLSGRHTVVVLENRNGEIVALDEVNFGIRPDEGGAVLLAVNLPDEMKKAGTMIRFSGQVKETDSTDTSAGQPFVLSHVEEI